MLLHTQLMSKVRVTNAPSLMMRITASLWLRWLQFHEELRAIDTLTILALNTRLYFATRQQCTQHTESQTVETDKINERKNLKITTNTLDINTQKTRPQLNDCNTGCIRAPSSFQTPYVSVHTATQCNKAPRNV